MIELNSSEEVKKATQGKSPFIKLEKGKTKLRIVSKIAGLKEHRVTIKEQERAIICPAAMEDWEAQCAGRPADRKIGCPVCMGNDEKAKKLKTQFLAIAVTERGEVGVLKKGTTVFGVIAGLREAGYDLSVTPVIIDAVGDGLDREYAVIPAKEDAPLNEDEKAAVAAFEATFDLEQRTTPLSYENIVRKLKGEDPIFDDEQEDA